jgi:hypothetical protein
MKAHSRRRWALAAQLLVAVSLLIVGAASCSDSNSGGCNFCPASGGQPVTAAECEAAGQAAGCETAELVQNTGETDSGHACGAGTPYAACNWTNCEKAVNITCN